MAGLHSTVESAGEAAPLLERLRRGVYEESDNETDVFARALRVVVTAGR